MARTYHPPFSNFLFTNLFSIKFLYFFIISSLFPYLNLFVSIFIQSYVNIKLHVSTLYIDTMTRYMTAAMGRGHIYAPIAGKAYATKLQNKVNLYPCQWCCCKFVVTMDCSKSRQKGVPPRVKSSIRSFRNQMSNCTKHK